MIFIGLGANLPSLAGPPRATLEAALERLSDSDIRVVACSRFYASPPFPPSDQPWFVNAVARLETALGPAELLARLHEAEHAFGRRRSVKNEARVLDLDIIAYDDCISDEAPILPHPRLSDRAFVLLPLSELAPAWRHPKTGESLTVLIGRLPPDQLATPIGS